MRDLPGLGLAVAAAGLSLPFVAAWLAGGALRRGGEPALLAGLCLVLALLQEYAAITQIDRN